MRILIAMYWVFLIWLGIYKAKHYWWLVVKWWFDEYLTALNTPHHSSEKQTCENSVVVVQLPSKDEGIVAIESLRCAFNLSNKIMFKHPFKIIIQVLDNSQDSENKWKQKSVDRWRQIFKDTVDELNARQKYEVQYYNVQGRGKVSALQYGLEQMGEDVEFVAILDADFRPDKYWLGEMLNKMSVDVGLIQSRWDYSNFDTNLTTRGLGTLMDAHFVIEKDAATAIKKFVFFNGSAGVFRKEALLEVGGWDTEYLTSQDTEISSRIARKTEWKSLMLNSVRCSSTLPTKFLSGVVQQMHWMEGVTMVCKRNFIEDFKQGNLWEKIKAIQNAIMWTTVNLVLSIALIGGVLLFIAGYKTIAVVSFVLGIPYLVELPYFYIGSKTVRKRGALYNCWCVLVMGCACLPGNTIAVVRALMGIRRKEACRTDR